MKPSLKLFYASDIHGSELVFRKFLKAAAFYGTDAVIFGGDLTGKSIVPLVRTVEGLYRGLAYDAVRDLAPGAELAAAEQSIRDGGSYPYLTTPEEVAEMERDPEHLRRVFSEVMRATAEMWVSMADEKLREAGIPALMMPGNDDEPAVKQMLAQGDWIIDAEGRAVELGDYRVLSYGYATTTPWHSPREVTEEDMGKALDRLSSEGDLRALTILNLHDPPSKSGLDLAYRMSSEFQVQMAGGQAMLTPVGSTAVRELIERIQPVLALHGHIHESRGVAKIGKTVAINPGSSYTEGVLQGVIVTLSGDKVVGQQLVTG